MNVAAIERKPMDVEIRPLRPEDIQQVSEIERQAFPTLWPPTPFKRELGNRRAKYLLAWDPGRTQSHTEELSRPQVFLRPSGQSRFGRLMGAVKGCFGGHDGAGADDSHILGFVGLWFMSGEAHITAIAVEESSRGKGIGELLLIGSVELAMKSGANVVTLEVRVSNEVAQSLYGKYGFRDVGIRRAYYTDNREDAVIMTTDPLNTPGYQGRFAALVAAYRERHGEISMVLT